MKIAYNDGVKLSLSEGEPNLRESDYITNYYTVTQKSNDSLEWKTSGYGAAFRGETQGPRSVHKFRRLSVGIRNFIQLQRE